MNTRGTDAAAREIETATTAAKAPATLKVKRAPVAHSSALTRRNTSSSVRS